jgi:hypothetical protein
MREMVDYRITQLVETLTDRPRTIRARTGTNSVL